MQLSERERETRGGGGGEGREFYITLKHELSEYTLDAMYSLTFTNTNTEHYGAIGIPTKKIPHTILMDELVVCKNLLNNMSELDV